MKLVVVFGLVICSVILASTEARKPAKKIIWTKKPWVKIFEKLKDRIDGDTDLMHVMDSSGSIGSTNFNFAKQAAWLFTLGVGILAPFSPVASRMALIKYSEPLETSIQTHFGDHDFLLGNLAAVNGPGPTYDAGSSTATALALWLAIFEFMSAIPTDVPPPNNRFMVIYTDGHSNVGGNPAFPAAILRKKLDVEICAVGIGYNIDVDELEDIAGSPDNVLLFKSFSKYLSAVKKAIKMVKRYVNNKKCKKYVQANYCPCPAPTTRPPRK